MYWSDPYSMLNYHASYGTSSYDYYNSFLNSTFSINGYGLKMDLLDYFASLDTQSYKPAKKHIKQGIPNRNIDLFL